MSTVLAYPTLSNLVASDMCLGPDNNVWAVGNLSTSTTSWYLWKVTPAGSVTTYALPTSYSFIEASICADATFVYVCSNSSSFSGIRQYTTSGVLNATLGTALVAQNDEMCFDGTNLWTVNKTTALVRTTLAGVMTTFTISSASNLYSICYDAGSGYLFCGNNSGTNSLIKILASSPATNSAYSNGKRNDPHQCTDGTYIWQCNDWNGVTQYLISNPSVFTNFTWAGPTLGAAFWYVVFDGASLWFTNTLAGDGAFFQVSPSSPTTGTAIQPVTGPAPGADQPMCVGPSSQVPSRAPWAGGTGYVFTIASPALGQIVMIT